MEYLKVLEHAILYIEQHLTEPIRVEEVARAAGYSYYHLTRQFSAVLGESVGSYIKKRRLSEASKQLLYTDRKIIDIAMEYGFESSEAFSRAFKAVYQTSPASYRKNRIDLFISAKPQLDSPRLNHLVRSITVHPRIVELPDILVAGLRGQTTLADNTIPQLWNSFMSVAHRLPDRIPDGRGFGICEACQGDNTLYSMCDEILFSEVAGTEVSSLEHLEEPFVGKVLRGGRYAVFTYTGLIADLSQAFEYIWGTWFLNTQETLDEREDFELYDERFLGRHNPQSQIDLYIPIK